MTTTATPACCDRHGLFYPGDRRVCWQHATAEDRELLAALDARAAAHGLRTDPDSPHPPPRNRVWPCGPDISTRLRMLAWAEKHNLRLTEERCLDWLYQGACTESIHSGPEFPDRVTGWTNQTGDTRVVVYQPPRLAADERADLEETGTYITVEISTDSWYGDGSTFVAIWSPPAD